MTSGDPIKTLNVTNCPPSYDHQSVAVNANSTSAGKAYVWCGGYSRLAISVAPTAQVSDGTFFVSIYLSRIEWEGESFESYGYSTVDVTFSADNGTVTSDSVRRSLIIETKGSWCYIYWGYTYVPQVPDWWITFYVHAYLRNE